MRTVFLYIIFIYCLFFIFAGLLAYHFREVIRAFKELPKTGMVLCVGVVTVALVLRIFFVKHDIFYDEPMYLNVAQNMYYHHQSGGTLQGTKLVPEHIGFYNRPGGHPFLINIFYLLFGESEKSALLMNPLLGTASVGIVFLFTYWLFESAVVAFCASALVNVFPIHLACSGSISSEVPSFFFVSLALLVLVLFNRSRNTGLLYFTVATAACSFYIRPENMLFVFPLTALFLFLVRDGQLSKKQGRDLFGFFIALIGPLIVQLLSMKRSEAILNQGQFWTVELLLKHLPLNVRYLFDDNYMPRAYTLLFVLGGCFLYKINKKVFFGFLVWFLVFFISYAGHLSGDFSRLNRYFFIEIMPVCVVAAVGINYFFVKCGRRWGPVICGVLLVICGVDSFPATGRVYARMFDSREGREYSFLKQAGRELVSQDYVVTVEPYVVVADLNRKAIHYNEFKSQQFPYQRVLLLKTVNWEEKSFLQDEQLLKQYYDFRILVQKQVFSDSRTFIAELTRK